MAFPESCSLNFCRKSNLMNVSKEPFKGWQMFSYFHLTIYVVVYALDRNKKRPVISPK